MFLHNLVLRNLFTTNFNLRFSGSFSYLISFILFILFSLFSRRNFTFGLIILLSLFRLFFYVHYSTQSCDLNSRLPSSSVVYTVCSFSYTTLKLTSVWLGIYFFTHNFSLRSCDYLTSKILNFSLCSGLFHLVNSSLHIIWLTVY
jgi:hypothetical protein